MVRAYPVVGQDKGAEHQLVIHLYDKNVMKISINITYIDTNLNKNKSIYTSFSRCSWNGNGFFSTQI